MNRFRHFTLFWLAPLIAGALLALCYPPFDQSWLVWLVPGTLVLLVRRIARLSRKPGRSGFRVGWLAGASFFLINLKWLWTVTGVGAVALALFLALFWGLWGWVVARVLGGSTDKVAQSAFERAGQSLWAAAFSGLAWVSAEFLRGKGLLAFSWNGLGTAFHETPVIAQSADLVGVMGLSFVPVFISTVLAQTIVHMRDELRAGKLRPHLDFGIAMLFLVGLFVYGVVRIQQFSEPKDTESLGVLVVQQEIPQSIAWTTMNASEIADGFRALTSEAIETIHEDAAAGAGLGEVDEGGFQIPSVDLVVWPEVALGEPLLFLESGEQGLGMLNEQFLNQQVLPLGKFSLLTGMSELEMESDGERWTVKEGGRRYNSLAAFSSDGQLLDSFRKTHLVIYGEYIPFIEQVPFLKTIFEKVTGQEYGGNIDAGTARDALNISAGGHEFQVIPSVCFEDTVAPLNREFVNAVPQVIVNVTNDGWFYGSEGGLQHSANAVFRCIELRRPMIRCANAGVSGIIRATGTFYRSEEGKPLRNYGEKGWVYGRLPLPFASVTTVYAQFGDWFCWLSAAVTAVFFGLSWRRRKD